MALGPSGDLPPLRRISGRLVRAAIALAVLAGPACVIKLSERNAPLPNGGVTGPAADCSKIEILPKGAPGGDAGPKLVGRFDMTDPARPRFDWSGTYVEARFEGTEVTVGLEVDANPMIFTAIIDDRPPVKFTAEPARKAYLVAQGLTPGAHQVVIHRETEAQSGVSTFTGFDFGPGGKLLPPVQRPRRIEIIGDSITCGFGDEGPNGVCPYDVDAGYYPDPTNPDAGGYKRLPVTENNYLAYGSIAARALDADVVTICWSGKGVYQNYTEKEDPKVHNPGLHTHMPAYYLRTLGSVEEGAPWDFKDPEPQAVVINLGTNDFSYDNDTDGVSDGIDLAVFREAYMGLVKTVREKRPNAHIFLAVPPMLTDKFPLDNARSDCAATLKSIASELNAAGDPKVYEMELVEMGTRYGLGCNYHPNLEVHRIMADQVAGAIRSKTCW